MNMVEEPLGGLFKYLRVNQERSLSKIQSRAKELFQETSDDENAEINDIIRDMIFAMSCGMVHSFSSRQRGIPHQVNLEAPK